MISSKLVRVALGVAFAEGWSAPNVGNQGPIGSVSYNHHNPGNLRSSEYEAGNDGRYSIFNNDFEGFMALCRQLELIASGKNPLYVGCDTVEKAFARYTADRDPSPELMNYLAVIKQFSGVNPGDNIGSIL